MINISKNINCNDKQNQKGNFIISQQSLKQKLKEIQEQKQEIQNKKELLEKLEKEIIETEKLYQKSLEQENQKQENTTELSKFIDSKIAEFEEKAKELNLTKLKFKHSKDKRSLELGYIDQDSNEKSIFYIHDYSYDAIKLDIEDMLDFHIKNIEIYNQLINELPEDFFNYVSFYYDKNMISFTTETTSASITPSTELNHFKIYSWIIIFDIESFVIKLENNFELDTSLYKDDCDNEINFELSRTSIVQLKDIAKQITQDMMDLNYQINNNLKIEYL